MTAPRSSSRLLSQLLQASKLPGCSTVRLPTRTVLSWAPCTLRPIRQLSATSYHHKENTAPPPPSQSQSNASVQSTVQTPTGATTASPGSSSSSADNPLPSSHQKYTFAQIQSISNSRNPHSILIDVREPSELQASGTIPSSLNLPLKTSPDFMFLTEEEFEDRFGRPRPGAGDEVIFYCRSGVRSKAAAELAKQAGFGGTVSEFPGSWLEWEKNGGEVEKV